MPARPHPRARVAARLGAAGLALGLFLLGTAGSTGTALASPRLKDAKAKAAALRAAVDRLTVRAEQAAEEYDAAQERLGKVVTRHLLAQRQVEAARGAAQSDADAAGSRVRALYRAGGSAALYASVLDGGDITDVLTRVQTVRSILDSDAATSNSAQRYVSATRAVETDLAALAREQTRLETAVAAAAARVQTALAEQQRLLAAADEQVRQIAEADRIAAEQAAARRAAAALAAAQARALGGLGQAGPPAGPVANAAIAAARSQLGKPYQWGATGPSSFDCSGLTGWAYAQAGVTLPRTAAEQWYAGPHPDLGMLAPGDLLFWATSPADPATIHHVAIYLGGGLMIAAPHTGALVQIQPVYLDGFIGATRPTA